MIVGIEALRFYTSRYYLDLELLAYARGIDPEKYTEGLGQQKMGVLAPNEDIVTMGASAAKEALEGIDPHSISMVLSATESGVDHSKASGIWIHNLLNLGPHVRVVELKQACYSGCAALMLAQSYLKAHPDKKVLLIATDVARYGLNTPGEPTQGCGACAIVLSTTPKLALLDSESGYYCSHVMDFWRPNYRQEALVDGKYSTRIYLSALTECWEHYVKNSQRSFSDHERFCYHIPFTKMAQKAHERLAKHAGHEPDLRQIVECLTYSRQLGNSYTASLFIGLCSLLETAKEDLSNKRIGLFSYGSGCVAEFFSATVLPGYTQFLSTKQHEAMLQNRTALSMQEYEAFYQFGLPEDGSSYKTPSYNTGSFCLAGIEGHQRRYTLN